MYNRFDGCLTTSASGRCVGRRISSNKTCFFNGRSQNWGLVSLNFGSPFAPTTLSFAFTSFPPFFVIILLLILVFATAAAVIFVNVVTSATIIAIVITIAIAASVPIAITSSASVIAGHRAAKGWRPIAARTEATPTASETFVAETSAASKASSAASASSTSSIPWGIPVISVKNYFDLLVCKIPFSVKETSRAQMW